MHAQGGHAQPILIIGEKAGERGMKTGIALCPVYGVHRFAAQKEFHRRYAGDAQAARALTEFFGVDHDQQETAAVFRRQFHQTRHQDHARAGLGRPEIGQHQAAHGVTENQLVEVRRRSVKHVRGEWHGES
jgi:hypothetical protein